MARLKLVGQWFVVALVLFFLGRILAGHWSELKSTRWQVDLPLLTGSYGLLGLAWLALVANWRWLMRHMGAPLSIGTAWRIWFLSNIVRYVPGNVWQFLGMVYLCEKEGIARTRTLASILVYQTASVASGLLAASAVYLAVQENGLAMPEMTSWTSLGLIAGVSVVALVACMPPVMNWGLRLVFRLFHRQPVRIELTVGDLLRFFVQRLGIWGLQGLAFAVFVQSVYPVSTGGNGIQLYSALPLLGAAFVLSWVIGFVSLLTPSGLGVREAAQTALLATVLPLPVSVALALLSRLWLIGGEVTGAALGLALGRWEHRPGGRAGQLGRPGEIPNV